MKDIELFIQESINPLPKGTTGLLVFDIDDSLLKADMRDMRIIKHPGGDMSKSVEISTGEYARDPDAGIPEKAGWFDMSDFRDPDKVYRSIINAEPIVHNLKIMDSYINAGWDFCFLTARSCEPTVKKALGVFLRTHGMDGLLYPLGGRYRRDLSCAVNDMDREYPGRTDFEKKAGVLRGLCRKYDRVLFVDDDAKNVRAARGLDIRNLRVINVTGKEHVS
jgi:hypothetical protein